MRRVWISSLGVALMTTATWAHVPADRTFLAFQWPDNAMPTIDGNLSEWAIVPDVYQIHPEDTHEALYGSVIDKSNLDYTGYVAWNKGSNQVLIASRVFDNYHERDNTDPGQCNCSDDNVEFWIDGDHAGDPYVAAYGQAADATADEKQRATNSTLQWYSIAVPPVGGRDVQSGNTGQWQFKPPYFNFAWSFTGEEFGESTYFYEMAFTSWDDLDFHGADTSTKTQLSEGNIFGLNLIWSDYDGPLTKQPLNADGSTTYDGYWITGGPCCDGVNASDFLLAPVEQDLFSGATAVSNTTWGRLKSRFVQ